MLRKIGKDLAVGTFYLYPSYELFHPVLLPHEGEALSGLTVITLGLIYVIAVSVKYKCK